MSLHNNINYYRYYEGEWNYSCNHCDDGPLVEFNLSKYDQGLHHYLQSSGIHKSERCKACGGSLAWESYTAPSPMTDSLVSLLENKHFMASTVILSAIVENAIQDLVWASLVDKNIEYEQANVVANSRMNRVDCLNLASALIGKKIKDIQFPIRNLVAHGKGFEITEKEYKEELKRQALKIREWVENIVNAQVVNKYRPSEVEKWLLFMTYWADWFESYAIPKYL